MKGERQTPMLSSLMRGGVKEITAMKKKKQEEEERKRGVKRQDVVV